MITNGGKEFQLGKELYFKRERLKGENKYLLEYSQIVVCMAEQD